MKSQQTTEYNPTDEAVRVLFEDADLLVAVKPANLLSVPGKGAAKKDCAEYRLFKDGRTFVRAAHRLDQDTSGLILYGASPKGHRAAAMMFEARAVTKRYEALAWAPAPLSTVPWVIDLPLALDWPNRPKHHVDTQAGKPSKTGVRLMAHSGDIARLELEPITGRSHQLRVHLAHTGLPILGDPLYGEEAAPAAPRLCLHATHLAFTHPLSDEPLSFQEPAPF